MFDNDEMAEAVYEHFDSILGSRGNQQNLIALHELRLPSVQEVLLDECFSEEEIWQAELDMPTDKTPGPDGFTGMFYRAAWPIIKPNC